MIGKETDAAIVRRYAKGDYDLSQDNKSMQEIISTLIDNNVIYLSFFSQPAVDENDEQVILFKPDHDSYIIKDKYKIYEISNIMIFKNGAEIEDFIKDTYVKEIASFFFEPNTTFEKGYFDFEGKTYWNPGKAGFTSYFLPFQFGYEFEITNTTSEKCEFTVYLTGVRFGDESDDGIMYFKVAKKAVAVIEDGRWKLTDTIFADNYDEEFK